MALFHICHCFRCALETLDRLSESLDLTDFASRIIHPIIRTLDSCPELRSTAMDTLCSLVFQLGKQYSTFIPTVNKVQCIPLTCSSVPVSWTSEGKKCARKKKMGEVWGETGLVFPQSLLCFIFLRSFFFSLVQTNTNWETGTC